MAEVCRALAARRTTTAAVVRDVIALLIRLEQWDRAEWLARTVAVLEDPAPSPLAVADATAALHDAVLAPGGVDELRSRGDALADPRSLAGRLRDLTAQLYALTEPA